MADHSQQFGIFAKYWRPGTVKTRLAASVGNALAAELHRRSLALLLGKFADVPARRVLSVWPPDDRDKIAKVVSDDWNLAQQSEGNLGVKMSGYFHDAFHSGVDRAILIGSDSPHLSRSTVHRAFRELEDHDVVIGPCEDGGYYLIGCRTKVAPIWEGIAWSTTDVFAQTISAIRAANCTWSELEQGFDVDDIGDVLRLSKLLQQPDYAKSEYDALRAVCDECLAIEREDEDSRGS